MTYLQDTKRGDYLLGDTVSVADFYLFVMLLWAQKMEVQAPSGLVAYRDRMLTLPSVQKAMQHEGLT